MQIDDTFAEAFGMSATRLLITAHDEALATAAAQAVTGNASSVIGCNCEAAIERSLDPAETPDGRPGISVLVFAFSSDKLEKALTARVGQNVLTCPTTACFAGLSDGDKRIRIGGQLRYFGDGFQNSKSLGRRRLWRIPVMDGEFLCEDHFPVVKGIGGGNLLICGRDVSGTLKAALQAAEAIRQTPDVIMPFPSGIVRSGSKVGSRYKQLPASTNDKWCPTLRAQTDTELWPDENGWTRKNKLFNAVAVPSPPRCAFVRSKRLRCGGEGQGEGARKHCNFPLSLTLSPRATSKRSDPTCGGRGDESQPAAQQN
jgi:formylmethanofuran--tetrahydromethanopterin N-formyltransferase